MAWRAPVLDSTRYHSPFVWSSAVPEWNWVYNLDWTFLDRNQATLAAWVTNLDCLTIHNPQQFPFGLRAGFDIRDGWRINARLGSDIKGLSSVLFSLGELNLQVGVSREF